MALIAVSMDDRDLYVSKSDPARQKIIIEATEDVPATVEEKIDMENATVFELSPLDVRTFARIKDSTMQMSQFSGVSVNVNAANLETVRHGLKGWRNFVDAEGKDVPFFTEKVPQGSRTLHLPTDQTLSMLGFELVKELAERIKEITQVSAAAEKN